MQFIYRFFMIKSLQKVYDDWTCVEERIADSYWDVGDGTHESSQCRGGKYRSLHEEEVNLFIILIDLEVVEAHHS